MHSLAKAFVVGVTVGVVSLSSLAHGQICPCGDPCGADQVCADPVDDCVCGDGFVRDLGGMGIGPLGLGEFGPFVVCCCGFGPICDVCLCPPWEDFNLQLRAEVPGGIGNVTLRVTVGNVTRTLIDRPGFDPNNPGFPGCPQTLSSTRPIYLSDQAQQPIQCGIGPLACQMCFPNGQVPAGSYRPLEPINDLLGHEGEPMMIQIFNHSATAPILVQSLRVVVREAVVTAVPPAPVQGITWGAAKILFKN